MLRRNANFAESFNVNPISIAPVIAVPDLEAPGIRAKHWNIPMIKAALKVKSTNLKFSFLCKKTSNNKIANTILDNAIVKVLNNLC